MRTPMSRSPIARSFTVALVVMWSHLTGCSSAPQKDSRDPIEGWNRGVQSFNDKLDDYVLKPVATGYKKVTPPVVDRGVTNFYSNVEDITVFGNDLLQFKLLQSGKDFGRFFVNTTVGLVGFVDVASKMNLPKHNEDFDQTLATWGIPSGPYVIIPLLGPSTPRGIFGIAGDVAANPINWINPMAGYPIWGGVWHATDAVILGSGALRIIDQRSDLLSASKIMDEASVDRYEFIRNAYFQQRNFVIHDGNPPLDEELERQMDEDLQSLNTTPVTKVPAKTASLQ
ncbi:MAG: VacJ family lipoprotein [Gammaproteobacteria bacterium]|nr:VacJ family lipoprotein [Gammaproteobacteria bacterium]NBT45759.1 VacJ family lipoprotein [Gammaproteobacteria bacterium]NBY21984.1 VacJ family lipoprotein [Gammaproteobacteria bacterium]NDE35104.1 VacJ family lipoprotein [Gammaproteobacteria bacterium]NDE57081.1 VacJ family lipoprotein [Gammaproteobacteria bacterium]